ncbi:MAG: fasciclin domain-containing protein, partial [Odoribacter sp.]|nr:fasciclin domain-containing protein [Odoribacter sp.]
TMLDRNYFLSVDVTSYTAIKLNNSAVIKESNIELKNGYLNLIDAVLEPPVSSVFDLLKEDGRFEIMLSLFEENGLKSYLTDSMVTLFIEPDILFTEDESTFDPYSLSADSLQKWLKYHIFPANRYFINELDSRMLQPLYEGDVITFNVKKVGSDGKGSVFLNQKYRISNRTDRNALNGVVHEMYNVIQISDHTAGTIETNLYGATNTQKGYVQNVFANAPARVIENFMYNSSHQLLLDEPQPPICSFVSSQAGDVFRVVIPDVAQGSYMVRLIYNGAYTPTVRLLYNNVTVVAGVALGTPDGDFAEYTVLKYKNFGIVTVNKRGDMELTFMLKENTRLLMDRIDLIPNLTF